jgi:hypothetical protein
MANGIGYNGISTDSFNSSNSGNKDDFFEIGKAVQESISKITLLADAKTNEMLQRLDKDYKAFSKGIQSALNDTSYFREGVKAVDPKSGRSYMEYYVQTSEVENAMSAVRYLKSKLDAQNVKYETRPPQQMDYITGTRTFEGKQAQAKALYEVARKGGKLIPNPTADNPDQYTYLLPFSTNWARGVGETDYLDFVFEGSDALSRLEHDKRASEAEVDRNYAKAKKAEMINKLSLSQRKEAGSIWEQFEKEQTQEDNAKLRDNYALSKQMKLMDDMTASQAKEAGDIWANFEKEQEKESALALRDNYARTKQMKLMDDMTASQAKEAGSIWDDFEAEEERNRQRDIEVNYQANKRIKRENAQKEAEEKREQDKKQRELERQQAKDSLTSKAKRMFLLGQIASMFTVLLDLTRRILSNGLSMASDAKRTEREARNIGSSYASMLQYNYADAAYGLAEGTTPNALFTIQKMFGDPANLDTKALGQLAMVMGNSVGDAVQSGLGGKNPEKLMEMIMNAFIKSQQAGVNQFGQQVGKEEARRNLYTLLSEISPEIAALFSRAVEANDFGIYKGRVNTWQDYLNINRRIQGGVNDADVKAFSTLGEVVDQLKAKFNNLKNLITQEFILNLGGVIDRINNANWGKNGAEQLEGRQATINNLISRREEILATQENRKATLESAMSEYGATVSLEQIMKDVDEAPDFWNTANYPPEVKARIEKNKKAVAKFYANNPLARSLLIQYQAYNKAVESIDSELRSEDPAYNAFTLSDEGIASNQKWYSGTLLNPEWTSDYFEGVSLTDFWENAVSGDTYNANVKNFDKLMNTQNPIRVAKLKNAYADFMAHYASKEGTRDAKDFTKALSQLYKSYTKGGGTLSLEKFSDSETNKMLAYILLMTGNVRKASNTAGKVYGEMSTLEGVYESDLPTISQYGARFLTEQGDSAVGQLQNMGFSITPVGGGIFTIKFVADVNGKTVEKDYKNVQLSGSYEGGIEYQTDGTAERVNVGANNMGY